MIDVFLVYSGEDAAKAAEIGAYLGPHAKILEHEHGDGDWKKDAKRSIRKAGVVLFVQGSGSADSPNIEWEIRTALRSKRPVMVCQLGKYVLPGCLLDRDGRPLAKVYPKEKIKERIDQADEKIYDVFSKGFDGMLEKRPERTREQLFEQYKIYLQTSEELVARRQSMNQFYLTINTALMTFFGVVFGLVKLPGWNKLCVLGIVAIAGLLFNI